MATETSDKTIWIDEKLPKITIDEQFKSLLPALDEQTYAMLEASLLENGCMHPLVLWNGILIDGHNRYEICQKHEIPFATVEKEFGGRDEALIWIITTQVSRRNLTPIQLSYFRGLHYRADKRIITNEAGRNQYEQTYEVDVQNEQQPKNQTTADHLAGQYNVSYMTIRRDAEVSVAIDAIGANSPEAKREILSGSVEITRKHLRELASGSDDEIKAAAESIAEGTFGRRKPVESGAIDVMSALHAALAKMADEFGSVIQKMVKDIDAEQLREALRDHIAKLEVLYKSI
jgi:hypothetical protein